MKQFLITLCILFTAISGATSNPHKGDWDDLEDRSNKGHQGTEVAVIAMNASQQLCQIHFKPVSNCTIQIFTEAGESVQIETVSTTTDKTYSIPLDDLEAGVYCIEVIAGSEKKSEQFVIE